MSKTSTFGHSVLQGDSRFVLTHDDRPWPMLMAGVLWLAAGLTGGYWGLQALGRTAWVPVAASPVSLPTADPQSIARALGQSDTAPAVVDGVSAAPVSLRYTLLGVVADRRQQGAALIAINGEPPRPYAVGASLEGGLVLQSVDAGLARLGPTLAGPSTVELLVPQAPDAPASGRAPGGVLSPSPPPMYTPPPLPVYTPPPMPVYTPPVPGASSGSVPPAPSVRGGDGATSLPAEAPPGS
ncbi:MAG TPA: type II secretion system protein N [Hydrogenophaga sp.]|uniref:type II secretion system protein N n=1 Tax=Hydrogenophaga sp. TaxID=1904254 RepID=UPI002BD5A449|nr:type II secretion system protein N [Hydrogenophaga sp.]HMN92515.1 type II secretion system protein N [Hydrogenophaga sp.]HMP10447.1 type II secretion system protein N [Hydrogenophaga sp.]